MFDRETHRIMKKCSSQSSKAAEFPSPWWPALSALCASITSVMLRKSKANNPILWENDCPSTLFSNFNKIKFTTTKNNYLFKQN